MIVKCIYVHTFSCVYKYGKINVNVLGNHNGLHVQRLQSIGMRCLVVNHSNDIRVQGDFVQSHTGHKMAAIKTDDIMLIDGRAYDAVAIDEAQFFSNLKAAVLLLVQKYKKHVIVAGLNGDYQLPESGFWRTP